MRNFEGLASPCCISHLCEKPVYLSDKFSAEKHRCYDYSGFQNSRKTWTEFFGHVMNWQIVFPVNQCSTEDYHV